MVTSGYMSPGSVRQIICRDGYSIQGPNTTTCLKSGEWTQPGVCQLSRCPQVPRITNAMVSAGSRKVGDVRQIFCQAGYRRIGSRSITCKHTLVWSTPPKCEQS